MTPDAAKRNLRRRIMGLRRALPPSVLRAAGSAAALHLVRTEEFQRARCLALYCALPDEVSTRPLFQRARDAGKRVLFPRMRAGGGLEFASVERWEDLRPGRYGVREPPLTAAVGSLRVGDLAILPGVAFDAAGRRLGRGGGAYDRTFAGAPCGAPVLFGLAAELQVVARVPSAPHDRRVDAVLTEAGVRRPERSGVGGERG